MKAYLRLTKTLMTTFFRLSGQRSKERVASFIVLGILGAVFSAAIAVVFALLGGFIKQYGLVAEAATVLMELSFIIVLVFGTIGIFSYVYFAKDNEFLFSLPVRNSTVYISKLTVVYFQELLISTLLMLPGLVALGIAAEQTALFFVMILLAVVLVPVCPLFLSSLIAIPMMTVASFFKNKGAVSAVLLILLFSLFMAVYFIIVMNTQNVEVDESWSMEQMIAALSASLGIMARVLYPLFCLARFGSLTAGFVDSVGVSAVIDLAVFLGTVGLGVAITILVSGAVYARSALKQGEHSGEAGASKAYVQNSALKALVKKEWRELVRNTSFAFQCLAGVVITPMFGAIFPMTLGNSGMAEGNTGIEFIVIWCCAMFMVMFMGASMNQAAPTAITREGVSFAYSKSMPVPYTTQIFAKVIVCNAIALVSIVLGVIAMTVSTFVIIGTVNVLAIVLSLILMSLYAMTYTNLCILRDAKHPKLDWVTPREAVKGNITLLVPLFVGLLVSLVCVVSIGVLAFLFTFYFDMQTVGILIGYTAFILISAVMLLFSSYRLKNNADALYAKLTI